MCQWLVFVVFMGRWSLAVCGTGVAAVRVTADARVDWIGFRCVLSGSVRVSGVFGGRDGCG